MQEFSCKSDGDGVFDNLKSIRRGESCSSTMAGEGNAPRGNVYSDEAVGDGAWKSNSEQRSYTSKLDLVKSSGDRITNDLEDET
jgi:hypothetical protein